MTTAPSDPLIGQTLDERYEILSRIARGGMAVVYLANDLRLDRHVAVKVMHEHLAEDQNFTRRFEQEARSAAGLSHPNLVGVFDQGHDAGRTYLVMEYLPSITLRELLKQQKRLTPEQALEISEAVLAGLASAHQAGIVHRDLKPENVMLADDGRIKLGDFGLARAVSANTTTGQALLGTIAYLSPELVTRGIADARSDLYAFGIMLYEMLTGSQPFTGEQPMQIAYQHAHSEVPPPSEKNDELTPELDDLVLWTTQREPVNRPRDAAEALEYVRIVRDGGTPANATKVYPAGLAADHPTPSTTVLDPLQREALATPTPPDNTDDAVEDTPSETAPSSPLETAAASAERRSRRGRIIAAVVAAAIILIGGLGWWFGQGPGSQISVPEVADTELDTAVALLESRTLIVDTFECSSLDVPAGLAARTEPEAGTRLDRHSDIRLCVSTGPEMLSVPTIAGLNVDEAQRVIEQAGFTVGDIDERFDAEAPGLVLAALGSDGEAIGDTYPEQAPIDLVASVGPLPEVAGEPEDDAQRALEDAGLVIDVDAGTELFDDDLKAGHVRSLITTTDPVRPGDSVALEISRGALPDVRDLSVDAATKRLADHSLSIDDGANEEAHHDDIPEGKVIGIVPTTDPVRPGDAIGLRISLGPELFAVPDVSGMNVREALATLTDAGFSPHTGMLEILWDVASVTSTDPAPGSMVPRGADISVRATITL